MHNTECRIVASLRDNFKNISEADTVVLHFVFSILHSILLKG